MRKVWLSDVQSLAAKALSKGGKLISPLTVEWDITGSTRCQSPYTTFYRGVPSKGQTNKWVVIKAGSPAPLYVLIHTPCRKCDNCMGHRAALWRARVDREIRASSRSWFGTLTLSPQAQYEALTRARARARAKGVEFETLHPDEQFRMRHNAITPEITKYLKRVRAQSGAPLRFMIVTESHRSGLPHYHGVIHELLTQWPVRHRVLDNQWQLGFTKWKLADKDVSYYVAKYLAKSNLARVRASLDYGNPPLVVTTE